MLVTISDKDQLVKDAIERFGLSSRGAYNYIHNDPWGEIEKLISNPWSPENQDGLIILGVAENSVMHEEVKDYFLKHVTVNPMTHLTYGKGPRGSERLRKSLASFCNNKFKAYKKVTSDEVIVLPGVGSTMDSMVWAICNEGEGILIPQPLYMGFQFDIPGRSRGKIVPVSFQDIDGYTGFDDIFDANFNKRAFENAFDKAKASGTIIKAVLLTHPQNPLGRPYPVETLKEVASFCGRNGLHLISDEIYAHSVFAPGTSFTSILAIDLEDRTCPDKVHMTYGASKDFCANGLRLGAMITRNKGLFGAVSSNSIFAWPSHIIQDVWASMLEDDQWRDDFFTKNHKLMRDNFDTAAQFFKDHGMPIYEKSNAAQYMWVDMRKYMVARGEEYLAIDRAAFSARPTPTEPRFKDREGKIIATCFKNGVMIGQGSSFFTEELGWFRVTFTVPREALTEGLDRLLRSLEEAQESWS